VAIAEAFAALGRSASTKDVQGFLEQKFGFTVSKDYISDQRQKVSKKPSKPQQAKKTAPKKAAKPQPATVAANNKAATAQRSENRGQQAVVADALIALTAMGTKVGWDEVENLVAVLRRK